MPRKAAPINPAKVRTPHADEIRAARTKAGQTTAQAASTVQSVDRRWREWEAGDHRMHPGLWELYLIRTQAMVMFDSTSDFASFVEP